MGLRFRKRLRLFPGLWVNVSKSGVSTSIGGDGVTVNYGKQGTRTTVSARGTGLSYVNLRKPSPLPSSRPRSRLWLVVLLVLLVGVLTHLLARV